MRKGWEGIFKEGIIVKMMFKELVIFMEMEFLCRIFKILYRREVNYFIKFMDVMCLFG